MSLLLAESTSVRTEPSVPHAEASWSVIVFSVANIKDKNKETLNCLIDHLEEEEVKVKCQHSIRLTGLITIYHKAKLLTLKFDIYW